jgi:hypothetical protein
MQLSDVYTEAAVGCQRFTRQFEQDSLVHSSKVSHIQEGRYPSEGGQFTLHLLQH